MRSYPSFAAILLCLLLLFGCAGIKVENQFIFAENGSETSRTAGACTDIHLGYDDSGKRETNKTLLAERISLLNWNIYKGQKKGWQEDLQKYGGESDLILLQEALNNKPFQSFFDDYQLSWNFNSAFRYKGSESGVLLASRVKPLRSCGLRQNEPIIGIPKTIVVSSFAIENSTAELMVANVHGINFSLGSGAYRQQFKALQKVLESHKGPILLAGDFNDWRDERSLIVARLAEKLSLTVLPFVREDDRTRFFGDPVDHIYYRGLEPIRFDVPSVTTSDHNPISAVFRVVND